VDDDVYILLMHLCVDVDFECLKSLLLAYLTNAPLTKLSALKAIAAVVKHVDIKKRWKSHTCVSDLTALRAIHHSMQALRRYLSSTYPLPPYMPCPPSL
jgi:hypothetical protein